MSARAPADTRKSLIQKAIENQPHRRFELLLLAVGSCTAIDVVSILEKKRQIVTDYKVEVTGERREEHPRSFTKINIHHIVYGRSVSEKAVADAIELSDTKYCSVAATVKPTAEITTSFEIIEIE